MANRIIIPGANNAGVAPGTGRFIVTPAEAAAQSRLGGTSGHRATLGPSMPLSAAPQGAQSANTVTPDPHAPCHESTRAAFAQLGPTQLLQSLPLSERHAHAHFGIARARGWDSSLRDNPSLTESVRDQLRSRYRSQGLPADQYGELESFFTVAGGVHHGSKLAVVRQQNPGQAFATHHYMSIDRDTLFGTAPAWHYLSHLQDVDRSDMAGIEIGVMDLLPPVIRYKRDSANWALQLADMTTLDSKTPFFYPEQLATLMTSAIHVHGRAGREELVCALAYTAALSRHPIDTVLLTEIALGINLMAPALMQQEAGTVLNHPLFTIDHYKLRATHNNSYASFWIDYTEQSNAEAVETVELRNRLAGRS